MYFVQVQSPIQNNIQIFLAGRRVSGIYEPPTTAKLLPVDRTILFRIGIYTRQRVCIIILLLYYSVFVMKTKRRVTKQYYVHTTRGRKIRLAGEFFFIWERTENKKMPTQSVHVRPKGTNLVYKTYNNDVPAVILFFRHFRVIHQLATGTRTIVYRRNSTVKNHKKKNSDRGG